jgi:hypothetical protein
LLEVAAAVEWMIRFSTHTSPSSSAASAPFVTAVTALLRVAE